MPDRDLQDRLEARRRTQLEDWRAALAAFRSYQVSPPDARVTQLGALFERLAPWLERAIRGTALRHFLLLPTEMLLGRLFARVVHREDLPEHPSAFLMWVEGTILRDLADPNDALGLTNGAPGEPTAEVQQRFHALPYAERALLYLALLEGQGGGAAAVAERAGLEPDALQARLDTIWRGLADDAEAEDTP